MTPAFKSLNVPPTAKVKWRRDLGFNSFNPQNGEARDRTCDPLSSDITTALRRLLEVIIKLLYRMLNAECAKSNGQMLLERSRCCLGLG